MSRMLAIISFSVLMFLGCSRPSDQRESDSSHQPTADLGLEQSFVGKSAAVAIDHFGVRFEDIQTHHHFGLSGISFEVKKGDHTERVFLWLDCKEEPKRGFWDFDLIRRAKVTKIASEQIDKEKALLGQTAGVVLDAYKVAGKDLEMEDEPPGKLRAVSFEVSKGDHTERIFLWLQYNFGLFSERRKWDFDNIRKSKVVKITAELQFK